MTMQHGLNNCQQPAHNFEPSLIHSYIGVWVPLYPGLRHFTNRIIVTGQTPRDL